jgi:hypothetical protein
MSKNPCTAAAIVVFIYPCKDVFFLKFFHTKNVSFQIYKQELQQQQQITARTEQFFLED